MKTVLIALTLSMLVRFGFAQSPVAARIRSGYDIGMAYATGRYNPSLTYYQLLTFGERRLFALGYTARLSPFYGDNLNFYTAPARLTRGKTGFGALGAPLLNQNIDTVRYDYVTTTALNLGIRAQVNLGRLEIGASADLLGLTLGRWRDVRYISSTGRFRTSDSTTAPFQGANASQRAYPTRANLRLLGDNDRGTLVTELYARVRLSQRVSIKAGYQWLTTEVTVDNRDIVADNNRFRHRAGMAQIAVTLPIFQ